MVRAIAGGQGRVRTGRIVGPTGTPGVLIGQMIGDSRWNGVLGNVAPNPMALVGNVSGAGAWAGVLTNGGVTPTFQADFTAISSLPSWTTLSRATTGTYFDSSGVLQTAAINAERFSYAWSGSAWVAKGLLIEEQRTNLYLQTGSPANQTITVGNGTTYTVSFYGTGTLTLSGAATQTMNGTSANVRTSYTFTASTTSLVIAVSGTVTYPNVEAGSVPTSHIPTTTVAVTRSADIVLLTGAALTLTQGSAFTAIIETSNVLFGANVFVGNGSNGFISASWDVNAAGSYNGVGNIITTFPSGLWSDTQRCAYAGDSVGRSFVGSGATVSTDTGPFEASTPTFIAIGNNSSGNQIDGYVRSLALYNTRLSDADLQTKSVVGASF